MTTFEPFKATTYAGGPQRLYRFDNGYGASVVNNMWSRGTEMAVIKWDGNNFHLVYDTPVTDDVINCLDEDGVREHLERISQLTEDGNDPSELSLGDAS